MFSDPKFATWIDFLLKWSLHDGVDVDVDVYFIEYRKTISFKFCSFYFLDFSSQQRDKKQTIFELNPPCS
jgi:hypothetical protein